MKSVYFDTSVIIAKYKQDDPHHEIAEILLNSKEIRPIISHITLIELASVISRKFDHIKFNEMLLEKLHDFSFIEKIIFLLSFIIEDSELNIYHYNEKDTFPYFRLIINMFTDYSQSILLSPISKLRTLDNLHIAALKNIVYSKNISIDYFVTGDNEILQNKRNLKSYIDLLIVSPQTLVELEGLE